MVIGVNGIIGCFMFLVAVMFEIADNVRDVCFGLSRGLKWELSDVIFGWICHIYVDEAGIGVH